MDNLYPEKLYVELTTRCNLHCPMCVKQAAGSCIAEGDLPLDVFKNLLPALAEAKSLILNGIGEPLLHPDLVEIIRLARTMMPAEGTIGFQSNGFLLEKQNASRLIEAGLDTMCLSLDSLAQESSGGHAFFAVSRAIEVLIELRKQSIRPFRIGVEMVLSQETIAELPELVRWAAGQEVDYLIATHLFFYGETGSKDSLFNPNYSEAIEIFEKYNKFAVKQGLNLGSYLTTFLKFNKNAADHALLALVEQMQQEARNKDIHLHLQSLIEHKISNQEAVKEAFDQARLIAGQYGIELFLPPLHAPGERTCPFIKENATFIGINGDVMPCHFLWHSYACRVLGEDIQVLERVFGNIHELSLAEIWQSEEYRQFRREAGSYEYASCWSCSLSPCAILINDTSYANDCYGSIVPCGHCQWSLGGVRCL